MKSRTLCSSSKYLTIGLLCILSHLLKGQKVQVKEFDYSRADSVAMLYENHSLDDFRSLSFKLTKSLDTDHEKFRAIYRWVCHNIENDYEDYKINKYKREKWNGDSLKLNEWNRKFRQKVFKKLIEEKRTVCTGFAYLVRELCFWADIRCEIVNGYGRTAQSNIGGIGVPNHSWNAVEIDKKWYLCDPTWSSGTVNSESESYTRSFHEGYFLTDPALFILNHFPLDKNWTLLKQNPSLEQFLNGPLFYRDAFKYGLSPDFPNTFTVQAKKKEEVIFNIRSKKNLELFAGELRIKQGEHWRASENPIVKKENGIYSFGFTSKIKGDYDLHLVLDNKYVLTYQVVVR